MSTDKRTDEERHADFIEMYRRSGGFAADGERMWQKSELERNYPKLLAAAEQRAAAAEARATRAETVIGLAQIQRKADEHLKELIADVDSTDDEIRLANQEYEIAAMRFDAALAEKGETTK